MKKIATNPLTRRYLEARGWIVAKADQLVPLWPKAKVGGPSRAMERMTFITRDLFGLADQIALHKLHTGTTYIQNTTSEHFQDRIEKARTNPITRMLLEADNGILVFGWRMAGPRGKRKTWQPRIARLTLGATRQIEVHEEDNAEPLAQEIEESQEQQ